MAEQRERDTSGRTRSQQARLGAAAVLGALVVAFALLNRDDVDVNWIFGTWSTPLIVVIVLAVLLGALLDRLVVSRRGRR
jgi:lipopolysaccharide assembly protein A